MGIYDREYYRREGPSFLAALAESGKVCKWLIAINVVLFILQITTTQPGRYVTSEDSLNWDEDAPVQKYIPPSSPVTNALDLDTNAVLHGQVWRLLTAAFLHGSFGHIFFNMLFLWWFGHEIENIYGRKEFLSFYIVSAFAGNLAYVAWQLTTPDRTPALGASGAVTAIMVLYALHYPMHMIRIWFLFPIPIWLFVLFAVAKDFLTFVGGVQTGVAVTAHLGGAGFAFLYYKTEWRVMNLWPDFNWRRRLRARPNLKLFREEPEDEPVRTTVPPPSSEIDEQLEAKLDAVLEKVARTGKDSLTDNEREILLRASEVYKRRRT